MHFASVLSLLAVLFNSLQSTPAVLQHIENALTESSVSNGIGWIKVVDCYNANWNYRAPFIGKQSLKDVLPYAISLKIVAAEGDINFDVESKVCSNPVYNMNHNFELSFATDMDTNLVTGAADAAYRAANWMGSTTATNRLNNGCVTSGTTPRSFDTLYHAKCNANGLHTWGLTGKGKCKWEWNEADTWGPTMELWLGFDPLISQWCQRKADGSYALTPIPSSLRWSWRPQIWGDFHMRNIDINNFDTELEFLSDHYEYISLEKCLISGQSTESAFYDVAQRIRSFPSGQETKILFYWNSAISYTDCYDIIDDTLLNDDSYWWYNDAGTARMQQNANRPYFDLTKQFVRDFWVDSLITIVTTAHNEYGLTIDGIFADRLCTWFHPSSVSTERFNDYNAATVVLMQEVSAALKAINPDFFILANGMNHYPQFNPNHCMEALPYIDAISIEHFGSHEEIQPTGDVNPALWLEWFDIASDILVDGVYGADKKLFVKSWVGPQVGPITPYPDQVPAWKDAYGITPTGNQALADAAAELITFPLAAFLCGMYYENAYFSYGWYWGVHHGYVPCEDSEPKSCMSPADWYPQLLQGLGEPLADGVINGYQCTRSFKYGTVDVDLSDRTSATITYTNGCPNCMGIQDMDSEVPQVGSIIIGFVFAAFWIATLVSIVTAFGIVHRCKQKKVEVADEEVDDDNDPQVNNDGDVETASEGSEKTKYCDAASDDEDEVSSQTVTVVDCV